MTEEEMKFSIQVNLDKAKNKTWAAFVLIAISILSYVAPLLLGEFDFGLIFEGISLVFLCISRIYMGKYDEIRAKRYNICAILSIGWLLVYDIITLGIAIVQGESMLSLGLYYLWEQAFTIAYIVALFTIQKNLAKANNPIKYRESTDWFYETYEQKNEYSKK